jgi:cytochrome P450
LVSEDRVFTVPVNILTCFSEDISKMKYLGCFLKEVMRQHTPVPIIGRMLDEPCVVDGVELPKGSFVDLAIHHAHHHPDVWEDPWVCHFIYRICYYLYKCGPVSCIKT